MSDVVISVENVSKQYRLGNIGTGSLSHDLNRWWHMVRGKEDPYTKVGEVNDRTKHSQSEYVWALRDISFEVKRGEVLGIIGRNGAGKSTLLKILSRTTLPTTGVIKTKGRIASLLEVGTGFHPELTGRENIFLNGAILGMTKTEIKIKFDEIVDFSGVGTYIDTPVKRYSSGMYVRLAFSVAAFLESEILIVDEVLAVGDFEFQKKCLGKMGEVSTKSGKAILFVSHDLTAIKNLCSHGLLITNGTLERGIGEIDTIISYYLNHSKNLLKPKWTGSIYSSNKMIEINEVEISAKEEIINFSNIHDLILCFTYKVHFTSRLKMRIVFDVKAHDGNRLFSGGIFVDCNEIGLFDSFVIFPKNLFNKGIYFISARLDRPFEEVFIPETYFISFEVQTIINHSYGAISANEPLGYFHIPIESCQKKSSHIIQSFG
jgi:lipopolysaccharide transport system ATP-binding protein